MEKINGYAIPFDISRLKLCENLIEQDGPLLSLYYNDNGDYYLFYWLDSDEHANRWLVLRASLEGVRRYLSGEKTLRDLVLHPIDGFVWVIDLDGELHQTHTAVLPVSNVPVDYLPGKNSYFAFDDKDSLLSRVRTSNFNVSVPDSDQGFFSDIMTKMGWRLSPDAIRSFLSRAAL